MHFKYHWRSHRGDTGTRVPRSLTNYSV